MRTKELLCVAAVGWGELRVDTKGRVWRGSNRADTGRAKGYLRVQFTVEGKRYSIGAHRLVWMIHHQRPVPDGLEINHKNGDKADNRPSNLEAVPRSHNAAHALHRLGQIKMRHTPGAKLSLQQVLEIRELCRLGALSKMAIARQYGVTPKTIRNIETKAKWRALFDQD